MAYEIPKEKGFVYTKMVKAFDKDTGKPFSFKVKDSIRTASGEAHYIGTHKENSQGRFPDWYTTTMGYWLIHDGEYHHVYKV